MRVFFVISLLILAGTFGIFHYADRQGEYLAERDLWRINQKFNKVAQDPKAVPDKTFNELNALFDRFNKRYPESKLNPVAKMLSGRVYLFRSKFSKAIEVFETVANNETLSDEVRVQGLKEIGGAHALQKEWPQVLNTYERILNEFPLTSFGLQTPLMIAHFHSEREEYSKAQKAFNDAILHYKDIIAQNEGPRIEFDALRAMSLCYMATGEWEQAIDVLGKLLIEFSEAKYWNPGRADKVIRSINQIAMVTLKDYDLAINIYSEFIKKNPHHKFSNSFQAMVNSLLELKAKNVELNRDEQ